MCKERDINEERDILGEDGGSSESQTVLLNFVILMLLVFCWKYLLAIIYELVTIRLFHAVHKNQIRYVSELASKL
jgi:hypothetical protein